MMSGAEYGRAEHVGVDTMKEALGRLGLGLADFVTLVERLRSSEITAGNLVEVLVPTGAATARAPHGLGRAYLGGFVVLSRGNTTPLFVAPADDAVTVRVALAAPAVSPLAYTLWVF